MRIAGCSIETREVEGIGYACAGSYCRPESVGVFEVGFSDMGLTTAVWMV